MIGYESFLILGLATRALKTRAVYHILYHRQQPLELSLR